MKLKKSAVFLSLESIIIETSVHTISYFHQKSRDTYIPTFFDANSFKFLFLYKFHFLSYKWIKVDSRFTNVINIFFFEITK